MKDRAIVSERGTITIPQHIREYVNIHPGDLIEFKPERDKIILSHLLVKHPDEEIFMTNSEWDKFDELIQAQFKKGQYKSYNNLDKAKFHSRNLISKHNNKK